MVDDQPDLVAERQSLQQRMIELDRQEAEKDHPLLTTALDGLAHVGVTALMDALGYVSRSLFNPVRKAHVDNILNALVQGQQSLGYLKTEAENMIAPPQPEQPAA